MYWGTPVGNKTCAKLGECIQSTLVNQKPDIIISSLIPLLCYYQFLQQIIFLIRNSSNY